YHASPVLSPQGDQVAYVATRDGLFDVYVAETAGNPQPRKVLDAQDNTRFESLRILTPGMSWAPDGRMLAVAVKSGRSDAIALVDTRTGRSRLLRPDGVDAIRSVAWSPGGSRIAFSGTSGAHVDLWTIHIETQKTVRVTNDLYADHAPAWTPDGASLVFHSDRAGTLSTTATTAARVRDRGFDTRVLGRQAFDLYRVDLSASARLARLTADPVWDQTHARVVSVPGDSTDFRVLYLSDENGVPNLYALTDRLGEDPLRDANTASASGGTMPPVLAQQTAPPDSSRLGTEARGTEAEPPSSAMPPADSSRLGDRTGSTEAETRRAERQTGRPLTNIQTGLTDLSVSADGSRAAVLALDRGTPSVYLLREPLDRDDLPGTLAPTIWAQRRMGTVDGTPPSLLVATGSNRERNPLLRDAADGRPPEAPPVRPGAAPPVDLSRYTEDELDRFSVPIGTDIDSLIAATLAERDRPPPDQIASLDTLDLATVGFRDYVFSEAFEEASREQFEVTEDAFAPEGHRNEDGSFRVRRYKLRFSPDIVYAAGAYDTVFGVQSVTQMLFSDVTGDHRIGLATNLVLDLRNSDYLLSYRNRRGRADWGVRAFHLARRLPDFREDVATVYRYRNYGLIAEASYPLSKFSRIDAEAGIVGVSLTDISNVSARPNTRTFALPRVTYTHDGTVPGFLGPRSGSRYAASVSGSPGPDVYFATALADGRRYWSLGPGYAVALRGSAGASLGPDPQRFFASGVQNWLNPTFRSLPVRNPDDFVFATPVLPLRGFGYDEANGDRFALVNAEARVPLIAAILPGPIPLLPLYNIQTVGFVDAGVIAEGGLDVWRTAEAVTDPETGAILEPEREVFDDVLLGTGVGLRTLVLGYPVRVDWAWPFDGREFGQTRVYFSVGLDF
ncbi:MAG: BamA/TamA family outer membrane protein, partial [Bacteroidota bacterium]